MRSECLKIQRKLKKEKPHNSKAMIVTWSDEEMDSSSQIEDQVEELCLMTHDGNFSEVTCDALVFRCEKLARHVRVRRGVSARWT